LTALRIAVAGVGLIGRRHVELVQGHPSCVLSGVVDPASTVGEFARRAEIPYYHALEDLLAGDPPDAVILATPNHLHVEQAIGCIQAGVAVLIEKPVAHTLAAGERLCEAVEDTGATVLVGHHRRHSPILRRAHEIIEQGVLGRVVAVQGSAMFHKPDEYFREAPWRTKPGGGPILINMVHEIDNLRVLCGEIADVQAFASNALRGSAVEDTVVINLRFAGGALGSFLLSDTAASPKSWEQTSGENPMYASYPDEECYVVVGTDGSLAIPTMRLRTYGEGTPSWKTPFRDTVAEVDRTDPLIRQLDHFCAIIRGEAEPLVTVRDALESLRVVEEIARVAC